MAEPQTDTPIIVDPNSLPAQIFALLRYLLTAGGAYLIGKGWIGNAELELITGAVTIAAPIAFAMWSTMRNRRQLVTVAAAAPDSVAQVK